MLVPLPFTYAQQNIIFHPSVSLSGGFPGTQFNPQMAISKNNLYVVWQFSFTENDTIGSGSSKNEILFTRSTDNGLSFNSGSDSSGGSSNILSLSQDIGYSKIPRKIGLAASREYVYTVWRDYSHNNNGAILFRESADWGISFKQSLTLSSSGNGSTSSTTFYDQDPKIAVFGNNVYVTWESYIDGNNEIFFRASKDNGESFGKIVNLSHSKGDSATPQLSAYGNNIYVVWLDKTAYGNWQTFISKSTDNGTSFDKPIILSDKTAKAESPEVFTLGRNVYVSWSEVKALTANTNPNIGMSPYNHQNRSIANKHDILFAKSTDNGTSFDKPIILSGGNGYSYMPKIAVTPIDISSNITNKINDVYVVWTDLDSAANTRIFFRASKDNGESFGNIINLSNNTGNTTTATNPIQYQLSAFENIVYVVWTETHVSGISNNSTHKSQILVTSSQDNGTTFGHIISLDNATNGLLSDPQITIASQSTGYPYVVWVYNRPNEGQVRFVTGS